MSNFTNGEKVLFISGNREGQFGYYSHHSRDSGYYVPFVKMHPDDTHYAKPWDREIISYEQVKQASIDADVARAKATDLLEKWDHALMDEKAK